MARASDDLHVIHDEGARHPGRRVVPVLVAVALAGSTVGTASGAAERLTCTTGATHIVHAGDTWFDIARASSVSMRALLDANDTTEHHVIHPGDELCLPSGANASSPTGGTTGPSTYTVASGDGWFDIARRARTTMRALLDANDTTEDHLLHPGDTLRLPDGARAPDASSTAGSSGSSGSPSGTSATYTVGSGDSWFDIARRARTTMRALLDANDSTESRLLHPGDTLRLPEGATALASSGTSSGAGTPLAALPVQGPCWYEDSWHAPRGGGRLHVGVDLFTAPGQYVYAVVDGTLTARNWDQPGRRAGNAWWLTAADGSGTRFFYAHLDDFAPDLRVGSRVRAGQIIGWVGGTGNAGFPHLHFEIRPGGGGPINPYPAVHAAGGCNRGTPYEQPNGWVPPTRGE